MSRARNASLVYITADDTEQAVEDLITEWSVDRRQRWVLDVDEQAGPGAHIRPELTRRTVHVVRMAELRAERDAIAAVAPDATGRLTALDMSLRLDALEAARNETRRGLGLA